MMNSIEELLSATADYFEQQLQESHLAKAECTALCHQGESPEVCRPLTEIPGYALTIIVSKDLSLG